MPSIVRITDLAQYEGQEVTLQGWVYNRTDKGKLVFLLVRDGYGFAQCVAFKGDLPAELFDQIIRLPQESSVIITGTVRADKRAPGIPGGFEVGINDLKVVQAAAEDYPMALKEHGVDFALDNRHLWIRMPSQWAILRVRTVVISAIREWFDTNGYTHMDTPILTPAACEGTTTLFETPYFDEGHGLPGPERAALQRSQHLRLWQGVLLRPHLPRREIQDPPPPDRVLDGRAGGGLLRPGPADGDRGAVHHPHRPDGACASARPELKSLGRDTALLEQVAPPFPRISYDDALQDDQADPG